MIDLKSIPDDEFKKEAKRRKTIEHLEQEIIYVESEIAGLNEKKANMEQELKELKQ